MINMDDPILRIVQNRANRAGWIRKERFSLL